MQYNYFSNCIFCFDMNTSARTMETILSQKRPRGRPRKNPVVDFVDSNENNKKRSLNNIVVANQYNQYNPNKSFANNENKNLINAIIGSRVALLKQQNNNFKYEHFFGVLDSKEMNTVNSLLSMGIEKESVLLVENEHSVALSHINAGFCTHEGTLENFADDFYDEEYSQKFSAWRQYNCLGWYFDTCSTILTQKKGIINTIRKSKLVDGSVLAFTFCRSRMTVKQYEENKELFIFELQTHLKQNGFNLFVDYDHDYSGNKIFKRSREAHMNSFVCTVNLELAT